MTYYSQSGQDKWVHDLIGGSGFYVEVGAYDGIQTSNTFALELAGWQGICIEGNRDYFQQLAQNRKSKNVKKIVLDTTANEHEGSAAIDTLDNILRECLCPKDIDYMSLDIEGQEVQVLRVFPFKNWNIKLLTIEHNLYSSGPVQKEAIYEIMRHNGFIRVVEDVKCQDPNPEYFNQPYEDWYASKDFYYSNIHT